MLGRLSSNSRLSFESHNGKHSLSHQYSAADSGSDLLRLQGFLQAHFHTSGTGSTFAAPSISIEPTICLVLWPLQMTAEPPNSKLAFYCHWIIICSGESRIHTKCGVSKEGKRVGEGESACVCVLGEGGVCVCLIEPDRYVIRADLIGWCWLITDILMNDYWAICWKLWGKEWTKCDIGFIFMYIWSNLFFISLHFYVFYIDFTFFFNFQWSYVFKSYRLTVIFWQLRFFKMIICKYQQRYRP